MFRGRQKGWTWRAIVAGVAAYALALNVIFASGLAGQITIAGDDPGGFEICLGHSGASDQDAPAQPDAGKLHCVLCTVGFDAPVLQPTAVVASAFWESEIISAERTDDAAPPFARRDPGKPPTGPPPTA